MASVRELKQRILSVKETKKITQAMKMVAAAKFKRATIEVQKSRDLYKNIQSVLNNLCARIEPDLIPSFFKDNKSEKQALIIIAGDRGLCGGFNAAVIKEAERFLKEQKKPTEIYIFGNKAHLYFKSKQWEIAKAYPYFMEIMDMEEVHDALIPLVSRYYQKEVGRVWLISNKFKTALTSELINTQVLPVKNYEVINEEKKEIKSDYIYDPAKADVLKSFLEYYFTVQIFTALNESSAGEEGARMTAMDSATDNAEDMIKGLSIKYNQSRQAVITKELSEIVGGAEALVN
ncbi:MAG: ATP synthase F1 subunit gamma [bacterium]|nr:ATP synthase F1 subunit gamma [bacterium]